MNARTIGRWLGLAMLAATAACASSTGPEGPSVEGTWTGTWRGAAIGMTLDQRGSGVTGSLQVGSRSYSIAGTVDDIGVFVWSGEIDQETCTGFWSSGLQLAMSGSALSGVMARAERALPCGSDTRVAVTQGDAALERAF